MKRSASVRRVAEEYAKHAALNFGQALQGLRYFYSHPDIDARAPRRTLRHAALSVRVRARLVANDLFFAVIPPHWHHTPAELAVMTTISARKWFRYGYCAWRFTDTGEPKQPLPPNIDKRWDPRCRTPS